ncbi:hypothetical protein V6N12_070243 [Hibiscus sabdariffa]|uniref:RNase H type-1 domain-containing protein n=1 Tax=Hibiscus sabdariffa TaxID=183260 RepID=A0ABR2FG75_9ROSI
MRIAAIKCPSPELQDANLGWSGASDCCFSVDSAYKIRRKENEVDGEKALEERTGNTRLIAAMNLCIGPDPEWIKLNSDGTRCNANGYSSYRGVIRDHHEVDNIDVFRVLKGTSSWIGKYLLLLHIEEFWKRDWVVNLNHVRRDANQITDSLAKLVLSTDFGVIHYMIFTLV